MLILGLLLYCSISNYVAIKTFIHWNLGDEFPKSEVPLYIFGGMFWPALLIFWIYKIIRRKRESN